MYRLASFLLIAVVFSGCVSMGFPQSHRGLSFKVIDHGIYERAVESQESDPSSPKGVRKIVKEVKFVKKTDKIPMKLGTSFGIAYRIESKKDEEEGKTGMAEILVIRSLPKPVDATSGSNTNYVVTKIRKPTNRDLFSGYTLESESDLIPGTWSFIVMYDEKIVIKKDFEVVDEEAKKKEEEAKKKEEEEKKKAEEEAKLKEEQEKKAAEEEKKSESEDEAPAAAAPEEEK